LVVVIILITKTRNLTSSFCLLLKLITHIRLLHCSKSIHISLCYKIRFHHWILIWKLLLVLLELLVMAEWIYLWLRFLERIRCMRVWLLMICLIIISNWSRNLASNWVNIVELSLLRKVKLILWSLFLIFKSWMRIFHLVLELVFLR
jgi:hypothetical protein